MFGGKIVKNGLYMVACLMIIVSMALAGCTPAAATAAPAEANPAPTQAAGAAEAPTAASQGGEKTVHLALVLGDMSNPFFSTVGDAAKAAAAAAGNVELSVLGTTTLEEQVKAVEDQISAKVDLIGVAPFDAQGITPTVEKANAAGIPIITVDETSAGGQVEAYIATDNVQGGALAGEWLVKAMDGKGKLAILEGGAGSSTNNARLEGLHSVLDQYPDITVVASLPADWARDKGMQVMNDVLTANPDLNAVMAMNDEMALGAVQAIKAAGKQDQIKLVGYNGALEAIKAVYTSDLAADVVQYPEEMGKLYVEWAVKILNGVKPANVNIHPNVSVVDTQLIQKAMAAINGQALVYSNVANFKPTQTIHLALVLGDMSNPFFSTVGDAAKAAAAAAGNVELSVLGTTTLEEQVKAVEDQISAKVDLIGVAPFDAQGITPTVEKANAAGIPIITVDETSAGGQVEAYIATDNVQGGALAGEWLVKAMDGKGKLAILEGGAGSSTNNARLEGLHSVLDQYPDITVVASLPADWARDKGMQVMNDVLTANPDLNAVMAMNDEMALGAVQAIKAAGKQDQIKLVGYNGALEAIKAVYTTDLAADVVQYPEEMGKLYVEWAVRILGGEKPADVNIHPSVSVVDTQLLAKLKLAVGE